MTVQRPLTRLGPRTAPANGNAMHMKSMSVPRRLSSPMARIPVSRRRIPAQNVHPVRGGSMNHRPEEVSRKSHLVVERFETMTMTTRMSGSRSTTTCTPRHGIISSAREAPCQLKSTRDGRPNRPCDIVGMSLPVLILDAAVPAGTGRAVQIRGRDRMSISTLPGIATPGSRVCLRWLPLQA